MIELADSLANAEVDKVTAAIDAGTTGGTISVYSGDRPDTPATAPTGTLLATFTLPHPSAPAASARSTTWSVTTAAPVTATIAATGTPSWFRVADSTGAVVLDGDAGTAGADLNFSSLVWVAGQTVDLNAGTTQVV